MIDAPPLPVAARRIGPPLPDSNATRRRSPPLSLYLLCGALIVAAVAFLPAVGERRADDFMFPRELLLHATALALAAAWLFRVRRLRPDLVDLLCLGFALLGFASAAGATDPWLATRALGLTTSGLVVLWAARSLARAGWERALAWSAAAAAAAVAGTVLLESYGGVVLSLPGRVPGGALGHRNSAAHLLVLSLPVLMMLAVRAARAPARWLAAAVIAMAAASIVLSRSRGAWLAVIALGVLALLMALFRRRAGAPLLAPGLRAALAGLAVGAAAAVVLPNQLHWSESSPEAETLRHLTDYSSGSGQGRLVQYARTMRMVADHPWLGVGPGNWMVEYPRYAAPGDPSYRPRALVPTNRLPQGDWTGLAAERGLPALLLLVLAGSVAATRAVRGLGSGSNPARSAAAAALLGLLAALGVLGIFDPVLLQPMHAFFIAAAVGALVPPARARMVVQVRPWGRAVLAAVLLYALFPPVSLSVRQLWSAALMRGDEGPAALTAAVEVSPDDYQLQAQLALYWVSHHRCDLARPHVSIARRLFPEALVPRELAAGCSGLLPPVPNAPATADPAGTDRHQ
ncbi:MAG TPA: O-antigen ligase family protein [Longimicrobiaceae bacterium]|nr:O-antigen ligase family protein [Longimicrobiaceae bacterium]